MKTDDLIDLLAADNAAPRPDLGLRLLAAAFGGAALSFLLLMLEHGIRPNLADTILNWRVATKFAVALTLAATSAVLVLRLARPMPERGAWPILLPAPLILVGAGIAEMAVSPPGAWPSLAIGRYGTACLVAVPLLSALPLAAVLLALQSGAPAVPAQAGAAAGAMAAGLGSALYALHCPDDSPLFLALFYGMGATAVILAGRAGGATVLRW
jgi:hypothetical protein